MIRRKNPFDIKVKAFCAATVGAAVCLCAAPAMAQDEDAPAALPAPTLSQPATTPESETPWYEAFTLSMNETTPTALEEIDTIDVPLNGGRWGVRFGIDDHSDGRFQREDVSAGAFVNLGDRFRLGGEVRFTAPESEYLTQTETEERQPEIKFESALRF